MELLNLEDKSYPEKRQAYRDFAQKTEIYTKIANEIMGADKLKKLYS